ncbi:MAG: CrcB family protein [Euryarchaeota archaeon]|nr:CrcB family protein [Euryarchaeota archaeon]
MKELVLVAAGGCAGAALRYLMYRLPAVGDIPAGTLSVNVLGCFLLPFFAGSSTELRLLLATGFAGSLTTFSTFGYESFRLAEHSSSRFFMNMLLNLSLSALAFMLGTKLSGGML